MELDPSSTLYGPTCNDLPLEDPRTAKLEELPVPFAASVATTTLISTPPTSANAIEQSLNSGSSDPLPALAAVLSVIIGLLIAIIATRALHISRTNLQATASRIERRLPTAQQDPATLLQPSTAGLRVFYYLDDNTVMSLYRQLTGAGQSPTEREVQAGHDREAGVGVSLGRLAPSLSRKRSLTSRERYEPENDPDRATASVERRLLVERAITAVDLSSQSDTSALFEIRRELHLLERRAEFAAARDIEGRLVDEWVEHQKNLGAERLSSLSGYVAVRADYEVSADETGDIVLVGQLILQQGTAQVSILCKQEHIRAPGRTALRSNLKVRATCLGTVLKWDPEVHTLVVLPVSVF